MVPPHVEMPPRCQLLVPVKHGFVSINSGRCIAHHSFPRDAFNYNHEHGLPMFLVQALNRQKKEKSGDLSNLRALLQYSYLYRESCRQVLNLSETPQKKTFLLFQRAVLISIPPWIKKKHTHRSFHFTQSSVSVSLIIDGFYLSTLCVIRRCSWQIKVIHLPYFS